MIRAAIVGLGRWGRALVNAVTGKAGERSSFRPRHDAHARAAPRTFAATKQIKLVDSYDDILRDPDIDAVVLATPHSQHQAQALAAIAAKKHVFVEKPLTLDLASARAVADAAHKSGLILAVGFTRRFHPSVGELRARVARRPARQCHRAGGAAHDLDGAIRRAGQLARGARGGAGRRVHRRRRACARSHDRICRPRARRALRHGAQLSGTVGRHDDDHAAVRERTRPGSFFVRSRPRRISPSPPTAPRVLPKSRGADLSRFRFTPASTAAPTGLVTAPPDEILEFSGFDMLHAQMTAFARTIRDGNSYPVPIADVLHGMAVFEAIVESAKRGGDAIAVTE